MRIGVRRDESSNIFVSLVISSCIWSSLTVLNAEPLVRARPQYLRRYKRVPDSNLADIDLLGTIGEPLPVGVSLTKGPYTTPAFHFRSIANVGRFARFIFPKEFFKEFSISVAIRPKSAERGVVFALLPHYRIGNVILGLEIRRASFIKGTTISLIHASSKSTRTVFDFTVPDLTGRWTWLSFSIRKNGVTFYKDCKQVEAKFEPSSLGDLTLPRYSALYIGRAGWTPGAPSNAFQGDIAELSMHRDPNKAIHQECKAGNLQVLSVWSSGIVLDSSS